jgi:asparagine synthase (glutamine-hydrolysing)
MCGINGIFTSDNRIKRKISAMNAILRHRGPDDEGYTGINSASGEFLEFAGDDTITYFKNKLPHISSVNLQNFDLLLGHRRLSIIDLSENGHGPMCDKNSQIWITFNGEIYNYIELREELVQLGYKFRSVTDTEVILNSYLHWGYDCLNKFNGMWAFAIWDRMNKSLFIARDRYGVKPVYYVKAKEYFAFSSEMKPLLALENAAPGINAKRIPFFLLYGNRLNNEETYFDNISCLRPAHYLVLKENKISVQRYYDIENNPPGGSSEKELCNRLTELLSDSIKLRFRSDVKVGTCLSGGFDSSSIVSFSAKIKGEGIDTISAVWKDKNCDESKYIDIVNSAYGCRENKIEPLADDFEKIFNDLHYYQEIPTEGPGLYPQWFVMKKAKDRVTVLLDGQGGDEAFGGYFLMGTYLQSVLRDKNYKNLMIDIRHFYEFLYNNGIHRFSSWLFPKFYNKVVRGFLSEKSSILNRDLISKFDKKQFYYDSEPPKKFASFVNNLSYHFMTNLTIPALLHYEDRSSMAHSIESRTPFLDYRLVEFGINLPKIQLVNKHASRPLFRKALSGYLPQKIVSRTDKLGYPTPFTNWTRTLLKSYIIDVFNSPAAGFFDYVNKDYLKTILNEHFQLKKDYGWDIWRLLSFERFLRLYKLVSSNNGF